MKEELENIETIIFDIKIVQIDKDTTDVIVAGEQSVLDAFCDVYDNLFYVETSKFGFPIVVAPDFPNIEHAKVWKEYWDIALNDPVNSCDSCSSVQQFFSTFLQQRGKYINKKKKNKPKK